MSSSSTTTPAAATAMDQLRHEAKLRILSSQTTYTREEASALLEQYGGDVDAVLRVAMGLPPVAKKDALGSVKSVNQAIFRQIRTALNQSAAQYRQQHPVDIQHAVRSFEHEDCKRSGQETTLPAAASAPTRI